MNCFIQLLLLLLELHRMDETITTLLDSMKYVVLLAFFINALMHRLSKESLHVMLIGGHFV